jgi:hypothetical protein
MRRQGIYGSSLPTKKSKIVQASDFLIGGLIGKFERKYKVAFLTHNMNEHKEIFGEDIYSSYYGYESAELFWQNVVGVDAKLYVKSHVGHTGSAYDGVNATASPLDGSSVATIRIDSAYKSELDYSISGNRTGYKIINGARFSTALDGAPNTNDLFLVLDSVAGIRVGDIIKCTHTGPVYVYKKITSISESDNKVYFADAFGSSSFTDGDTVEVMGFQIKTYRKSIKGIVSEVETDLGEIWCTMESEVTDFYVQNVHAENKWIKVTDLASVSALQLSFPVDVSTVTYLASGADGTSPTTASHWAVDLTAFDNLPIRMIANCESTDITIQKAIETYNRGRWDLPKTIFNIAENQSKAQLITIGNKYQRSDDVLGGIPAQWLYIQDPFATANNAPYRAVPNVGAIMGLWIRSIGTKGIHYIPAVMDLPIYGVEDVVGDQILSEIDRTDLCSAGVNVIQNLSGRGIVLRSWYTPSTTKEFMFGNGIMMRDFIKVSTVDSLTDTQNEPNTMVRIKESKMAVLQFLYNLWAVGSTGSVPEGETFGQSINTDGSYTKAEDHFQVQADTINNPQASIDAGERNIDVWFSYPAPASSIKIGVGILLRG